MATIEDVAREAGVSRSTVSYAMSGNRPITAATRARIDAAIEKLGFTVNAGARTLATAKTNVLALLLQFHEDEFAPAMLQYILGATDAARERGYDILMITDPDAPSAISRVGSSGMVDGMILLDVTHNDPRLDAARAARQPVALVGLPADPSGLAVFDLDFEQSARLIVERIGELGHSEAILVSPPREVFDRGGAYAWRFRDAAQARAAEIGIVLHAVYGGSREPHISNALTDVIDDNPAATCLIVHNDSTIAALAAFLRERGIANQDLAVFGLYSSAFARTFNLQFPFVDSAAEHLGRSAVAALIEQIASPADIPLPVTLVPGQLVESSS